MPRLRQYFSPTLFDLQEIQTAGAGRLILEALATGLISGFIIGVFRMAYNFVNALLTREFFRHAGTPEGMALTGGAILLCAVIAWLMVRHEPLISGSGIPQVELVLRGKMPMPWLRILWTKFVGTLASLSGGLSVGREGPCIQMGAAVGCGVGRLWHDTAIRPRFLAGGSTAGMTAAFGAPLAGMFFSFEELHTVLTLPMLLFTALTAASAWFVVDMVLQLGLVFPLSGTAPDMALLWLAPLAGLICGLFSCLYNRCLVSLTCGADRTGIKQPWRLGIAFLLSFVLVYAFPGVMTGLGPGITDLAHKTFPIQAILLLWAVKICFNWVSFASGVSGGILMPMLLAGGLTGALVSCVIGSLDPAQSHTALLVILCMAGLFAGTVRAPLTGAFLITEMTGAWLLLPALLCTAVMASVIANVLGSAPVYDSLRDRQLRNFRKAHPDWESSAGTGD